MKKFKIKSLHLDSARSFIPIKELKLRIDELSSLDFTHLQIGLTDDQGWRLESKKYPKLHELGSIRDRELLGSPKADATPYSGYYKIDEIKDLLSYANTKDIEIIPLVNFPGHSAAAIYCYPELSSGEVPSKVPTIKGRKLMDSNMSTMCYNKPETRLFIKEIIEEVNDIFNTEYIHLGFDEICVNECSCNECSMDSLQSLLGYSQSCVLSLGKKPIIWWREDRHSNFDFSQFPELTLQYWGSSRLPKDIPSNDIIFSKPTLLYFDYAGTVGQRLRSINDMGVQLVQPHALFKLMKTLPKNVVGVGACLWTENLLTEEIRSDFLHPRLEVLSDVLNGVDRGKFTHSLGGWVGSSYVSRLVKLAKLSRKGDSKEISDAEDVLSGKADELNIYELIRYVKLNYPHWKIDKVLPLSSISNTLRNSDKVNFEKLESLYDEELL